MKRKILKKGIAYLLTVIVVMGLVTYAPYPMATVHAAEPSSTAYATKEELMNWDYQNQVGKIVFGKDSSGNPMQWYILGSDSGVNGDNTAIFATSPIVTGVQFEDDWQNNKFLNTWNKEYDYGGYPQGSVPTEVYPNHYGTSDLRAILNEMASSNSYFTGTEQSLLQNTTVTTADTMNSTSYTTTDVLYALHGDCYNNNTILYAGRDNDKALPMSTYWNTGEWFWLRAPRGNLNYQALFVYSGRYVNSYGVDYRDVAVQPASNLNLSSVIFASAAPAASSDTVEAGTIQTGKAMTLRLDGSNMNMGNVIYDSARPGMIFVKKSANATGTVSLVVQGNDGSNDWYYSKTVTAGEVIRMADIKTALSLSNDISVDECEIWLETTVDGVAYAKLMENGIYTCIDEVTVTVDAPTPGEALASDIAVQNTGVVSIAPATKWTVGTTEVTGTADYNTAYTVTMNFTTDDRTYFDNTLTAKVNGETATITKNTDGTATVSYTFDATGMGTIAHTSEGYEGTYDGQGHGITVTVSDPTDVAITYSTDEGDDKTYSDTNPTFTNAGEYTVYYKIEKNDYTTITGSQTVNIAKREITITADDQSITWGSNISRTAYAITSGSLVDGEIILTLIPSTEDLTTDGTILVGGVRIKKYTVSSAEDLTDNYIVTKVSGKLIITHNSTLVPTAITATKETTTYIAGQTLNVDDLTVTATYADGYSEEVAGFTTNANSIDMNTAGDKTLTISYTANGGTVTTDIAITVTSGYSVTLPTTQTGYTITASTTEALWNGDVTFTFTLADGYSKTDAFAVKVNGSEITLNDDGAYTATNVKEALTVTVEGVADITLPTAEIKVKDNGWTQFLNTITFGIFFKDTQDVTITASDAGSGIYKIYYHISNEALTENAVKALDEASWTEYNNKFSIYPDNTYVVYAKVVDKEGNTTYISTGGLVLDGTAPVITGIEDNGVYYKEVTFGVTDTYLDKVLVDDEEITLTDGKYTIYADDKAHTIKATDKAGNEVVYTITVKNYGVIAYTATGADVTYDGKAHGITVSVADPADAKITYSTDEVSYSETNPTFTDVNGDGVTVYYRIEKENYITVEGSETVKIGKKELTITASDQTITYGDGIDTSKYTVSGLLGGHSIDAVTLTPSTTDVTDNGTIVVTIDKIVDATGNDVTANYDVKCTTGKLVIKEKEDEKEDIVVYEITDGMNSEWRTDDDGSITITGNGAYEDFVGIKVDGEFVSSDNYTVKSGSTIVTLSNAYLKTLSEGTHTFEMVWKDGSASTTFIVNKVEADNPDEDDTEDDKPKAPDTGDRSNIFLWILMLLGSGLVLVGIHKREKILEKSK